LPRRRKLHGKKLDPILSARTPAEQRRLLRTPHRALSTTVDPHALQEPVSLYALGIPPAQYDELSPGD